MVITVYKLKFCFCQNYHVLNTTLVIGRRTNVPGNDELRRYLPTDVAELAKNNGTLFMRCAEDYFIMTAQGYPWYQVPRDVVVGRAAYDNFLVFNALRHRVSVVDATDTVTALHQTDSEGNMAGHRTRFSRYNKQLLGRFHAAGGSTSAAQYVTRFVNGSDSRLTVAVEKRNRTRHIQTSRRRAKTIGLGTTFSWLSNLTVYTSQRILSPKRRPTGKVRRSNWACPCPAGNMDIHLCNSVRLSYWIKGYLLTYLLAYLNLPLSTDDDCGGLGLYLNIQISCHFSVKVSKSVLR